MAGIVYGALVALAQSDIKRLIAYSSVSHLGFCMLGLFAANRLSTQGGVLQMVNHGLSTGGLFAVVGMLYERYHTRQIADFGGLTRRLPILAFFTLVLVLSSIGLPGLNGFAGEFLLLLGMFQRGWGEAPRADGWQFRVIAVLSVSGVVLGAWYMLWMYQRVFFGPLREPPQHAAPHAASDAPPIRDLSLREVLALSPLAGVYPLDWAATRFLSRSNGADARQPDGTGQPCGAGSRGRTVAEDAQCVLQNAVCKIANCKLETAVCKLRSCPQSLTLTPDP